MINFGSGAVVHVTNLTTRKTVKRKDMQLGVWYNVVATYHRQKAPLIHKGRKPR